MANHNPYRIKDHERGVRPKEYDEEMKVTTIRIPLSMYNYAQKRGGIGFYFRKKIESEPDYITRSE